MYRLTFYVDNGGAITVPKRVGDYASEAEAQAAAISERFPEVCDHDIEPVSADQITRERIRDASRESDTRARIKKAQARRSEAEATASPRTAGFLIDALVNAPSEAEAITLAQGYSLSQLKVIADLLYIEFADSPAKKPLARKIAIEARG